MIPFQQNHSYYNHPYNNLIQYNNQYQQYSSIPSPSTTPNSIPNPNSNQNYYINTNASVVPNPNSIIDGSVQQQQQQQQQNIPHPQTQYHQLSSNNINNNINLNNKPLLLNSLNKDASYQHNLSRYNLNRASPIQLLNNNPNNNNNNNNNHNNNIINKNGVNPINPYNTGIIMDNSKEIESNNNSNNSKIETAPTPIPTPLPPVTINKISSPLNIVSNHSNIQNNMNPLITNTTVNGINPKIQMISNNQPISYQIPIITTPISTDYYNNVNGNTISNVNNNNYNYQMPTQFYTTIEGGNYLPNNLQQIPINYYQSSSCTTYNNGVSTQLNGKRVNEVYINKRKRRKYNEIRRYYKCNYRDCTKSYGTLNHLNFHIQLQSHGSKRLPSEFKKIREQMKKEM